MTKRPGSSVRLPIQRHRNGALHGTYDSIATEEPLEIRLEWVEEERPRRHSIAITMRTPGEDFELAAGFLLAEGVIREAADIERISYCTGRDVPQTFNVVSVELRRGVTFDLRRLERHFTTSSSCGVCGKASLEALALRGTPPLAEGPAVGAAVVRSLPATLRRAQQVFAKTGGLHAAGLFGPAGELRLLREDVGRHNALDKLVGHHLLAGELPARDALLLVSGRASFELVQKALGAGIPVLAAVGAPSSLAVETARAFDMTLLGFLGESGFNIYSGETRIVESASD